MKKMQDIILILNNYKKIIQLTEGNKNEDLDEFLELIKPYKALNFEEVEKRLNKTVHSNKLEKKNPKDQGILFGNLYYCTKNSESISNENKAKLDEFLALKENKILITILDLPFDKAYNAINDVPDKVWKVNQLYFLGMALLNIKLTGSNKAVQKKNLLNMLWNMNENQKMNEIYENNLL